MPFSNGSSLLSLHFLNKHDMIKLLQISFKEIVEYCEEMGFAIASRGSGLNRLHVDSFSDYIGSVFNTMYVNVDQLGFSVSENVIRIIIYAYTCTHVCTCI